MKIYIAASLAVKDNVRELAAELERAGFTITSKWLDVDTGYNRSHDELEKAARGDYNDLKEADVLLHAFTGIRSTGGGCDTELGMAIAWEKDIVILGERFNIFHWLPQVGVVRDVDELVNCLTNIQVQIT